MSICSKCGTNNLTQVCEPCRLAWCKQAAAIKGGKCLSSRYINSYTKMEWECAVGHRWETRPNHIQEGSWCKRCAKAKSAEWAQSLAEKHGGKFLSNTYDNAHIRYSWQCREGHVWTTNCNNIQQGAWCPVCAGVAAHDIEYANSLAERRGGKCLTTEYKGVLFKMRWQCSVGHQWDSQLNHIQEGSWCPICAMRRSNKEAPLADYVKSLRPDAIRNTRRLLHTKSFELDIYIPSLKKAIEFDGHFWHHSEWAINEGVPERDARKDRECLEAGIGLLRVDEKDWDTDPDSVLRKIDAFLSGPNLRVEPENAQSHPSRVDSPIP